MKTRNRERITPAVVQNQIQTGVRTLRRKRDRRTDQLARNIVFSVAAGIIALSAIAGTIVRGNPDPAHGLLDQAAALRTGAILIVAPEGHPCQTRSIDNKTWAISEGTIVDCNVAISQITTSQRQKWSSERVEAIRAGLTGR